MRGSERPGKVLWTHPFLPPLTPLSDDAAQQTFIGITDDIHKMEDINALLRLTDNMPLAIDLIAHLVDYEGCSSVLSQWETERTSLLSHGHDKRSSLDASIALSVSSPRITSVPGSRDLLSLLSILPDGLSDIDLVHSGLPINNILGCKSVLLATSLAYIDDTKRLRSLLPIREYVQHFHRPSSLLTSRVQNYFQPLLTLTRESFGTRQTHGITNQVTPNLGNIRQLLQQALDRENPDVADVITCIIDLNKFSRLNGHGYVVLMDHVPVMHPGMFYARNTHLRHEGREEELITEGSDVTHA
jgi:hypothetical protein